jgi:V8-like Glu-specific endopeptidase
MAEESPISREFVSSVKMKLAARRSAVSPASGEKSPSPISRSDYGGLVEAASVLPSFPLDRLEPVLDAPRKDSREDLISVCVPQLGSNASGYWVLRPEIRIAALRQLRETGRTQAALKANPRSDDPLQLCLTAYLSGTAKPVHEQTLVEVAALRQVADWVGPAGFSVPDLPSIERRAEWLKLLQPFEYLAGNFFRGRTGELARLRSYIGILPPGSKFETARRSVVDFFAGNSPMMIYGPGGVGKSTLVSRFILEHARALEADRFPFAYLDFDRPEITAAEPLTLLIEAVRQLGIEYPDAQERCERVRRNWLNWYRTDLTDSPPAANDAPPVPQRVATVSSEQLSVAVREFSNLLSSLRDADRPVVMVLDTFEEVQYTSDEQVAAIWTFLDALRSAIGRLCVLIVGRSPVPGRKTENMELKGLDPEAAAGYLMARGIADPVLAAQVAKLIGGNPINLGMASELVMRESVRSGAELGINTREYLFLRMDDGQVQRQLYIRVLGHIHDPRVRRVVHPGLVLRRLTPELIFQVLNRPCGLNLATTEQAVPLFEELRRESSLVRQDPDGALIHRAELRVQMLPLLEHDEPDRAREIHEAAVAYYQGRPFHHAERAEEIYHRLRLGQPRALLDTRWSPGIEFYLQDVFDEFSGGARAYLANKLGREVDVATRNLADLEDWEEIVRRKAADLLVHGNPQEALDLFRNRQDRTPESPLYAIEAEALRRLDYWEEAFAVLDRGISEALRHGSHDLALSLELLAADIVLANRRRHYPEWLVRRLRAMSEASLQPADRLTLIARKVALAIIDFPFNLPDDDLSGRLRQAFDALSQDDLARRPDVGWWAAIGFGIEDVDRLARVIRYSGLPRKEVDVELRDVAAQIASLDVAISGSLGLRPGSLAKNAGVPVRGSITAAWSGFLLSAPRAEVDDALSRLLAANAKLVPESVVRAFSELMRAAVGVTRRTPTEPSRSTASGVSGDAGRASTKTKRVLVNALLQLFHAPSELEHFLQLGLSWNLDSIAPDGPLRERISQLVTWADARGQLTELVESVRQANPADSRLSELTAELGIQTLAARAMEVWRLNQQRPLWSLDRYQEVLGLIEGQVCSVEIAGQPAGTAFLVGPDLVLTGGQVLEPVFSEEVSPRDVKLRFDLRIANDRILSPGTLFALADDWLVAHDGPSRGDRGLDYGLIRTRNSPGAQPIGGARLQDSAVLRNWLMPDEESVVPNDQLIITQHTMGGPLRLAIGKVLPPGGSDDPYLVYDVNTGPGSSGSPCFSGDLQLIGMHIGTRRTGVSLRASNYGLRITAIVDDLRRKNLGHLLGSRLG